MYSKPFSKIIASMDSPWLELSNGILLVNFRYRLSYIPFLIVFCFKIGLVGKKLQQGRRK
jgi:hypothetical protein